MKAIVISRPGGPEVLEIQDRPTPEPGPEEVLIEVKAAGLNRADIFQREGNYPAPPDMPQDILGLEIAGIVVRCGKNVTMWKPGDRVCALLAGGGYAEYAVAPEGVCLPVPQNFAFYQAASLPEALFTVWSNIFMTGKLRAGERLLVHGGNSGIGTTAIQLGKAFRATVTVTVGSEEKGRACLDLGADTFVNYKTNDFGDVLQSTGADVILDIIGGDYFEKNINILRTDGRLIYINTVAGSRVNLDLRKVMSKRLMITGSSLRSRDYEFKKFVAVELLEKVWPLLESGKFKPVVFQTFPFEKAVTAHQTLEDGRHSGKIILVRE